jgi:formate hydrogenlyase subunit 6/NADH:ubiquinone oxidoreductase subunit I
MLTMPSAFIEVGTTVSIPKSELDNLVEVIRSMGYEVVGPKVKDYTVIHGPLTSASDLPIAYTSHQAPGEYRLIQNGHQNYFDVTNGPHSWKQYFFSPKSELMRFHKGDGETSWTITEGEENPPRYAMFGVRPCDLAAIEIQDKIFIREAWYDSIYRDRRANALIIAVNCLEPCGTCFCASMGTGPDAKSGFDLCLTELENSFLVEIGSEAGRMAMGHESISWQPASAFLLQMARKGIEAARQKMGRELPDPEMLKEQLLNNLEHPRWEAVAARCMSCTSCTQVCPTCFCWNSYDTTLLPGDTIIRTREWDSCFNPDYSYVFGGNTRPNTRSRYRQWLTHKWASWYDQYGTSGCVGCGRCITWCPAGIDHIEEINAIRGDYLRKGESS